MKLEQSFTPYTKITSEWLKELNKRQDTVKLLEENIGKLFSDISCSIFFFGESLKKIEIKTKINKWDLNKFISLCKAKETTNKMKRQPTGWEKMVANNATNKDLISEIYILHTSQLKK